MKVWITKYALTEGIIEANDAEVASCAPSMISCASLGSFANFHGEGRDWHRTKKSAVTRAEAMRLAKIKSLQKNINKLNDLKFT